MELMYNLSVLTEKEVDIDPIVNSLIRLNSPLLQFSIYGARVDKMDRYYSYYFATEIHQLPPPFSENLRGKLPAGSLFFYSPLMNRRSRSFEMGLVSHRLLTYGDGIGEAVSRFIFENIPRVQVLIFDKGAFTTPLERWYHFKKGNENLLNYLKIRSKGYMKVVYPSGEMVFV